jgi:hypothetical membrane protein
MTRERLLLAFGVAVPFIYFANLFVGGWLTPGFDQASQMPSELGIAGLPYAGLFNAGLIAVGVALLLGAAGLAIGLPKTGVHWVMAALTALSVALPGFAMVMAGAFPLPNPLHYGFNVIVAGAFTPLLGAFAVGAGSARFVLFAAFALIVAINAVTIGVDGAMTPSNVGWWVRGLGLVAFSSTAFLCWVVMRRV